MPTEPDHIAALMKAQTDIVRLETHMAYQTLAMTDLRQTNATQTAQLTSIQHLLSEAKGGWRLLMLAAGVASVVGGFVTWLFQHFSWR